MKILFQLSRSEWHASVDSYMVMGTQSEMFIEVVL